MSKTATAKSTTAAKSTATSKRVATQMTWQNHTREKSMWAGCRHTSTQEWYTYSKETNTFQLTPQSFPQALHKIIDEVIVNATDHHAHYQSLVTEIRIQVNANGEIVVENDGPGIPQDVVSNAEGKQMYQPQMIASEFLAGDNLVDEGTNIKGGVNGIGLKLAGVFSSKLILETCDGEHEYVQHFLNGLREIQPPTRTKCKRDSRQYTRITFEPEFATLFNLDIEKFMPTLLRIMQTRAYLTAAYVCGGSSAPAVYYQNKKLRVSDFKSFTSMFASTDYPDQIHCIVKSVIVATPVQASAPKRGSKKAAAAGYVPIPIDTYPWDVCVGISDGKFQQFTIVNGMHVSRGGTHVEHLQAKLVEAFEPKVMAMIKKGSSVKFNKNMILNHVHLFVRAQIPSPSFVSQTKEAISDPVEKFANYSFTKRQLASVWDLLAPKIEEGFMSKLLSSVSTKSTRQRIDNMPKYREAELCVNAKRRHECGLIIAEGDSALSTAEKALQSDKTDKKFTYEYFGTISIQGVAVNALKDSLDFSGKSANKVIDKKQIHGDRIVFDHELSIALKKLPNKKVLENKHISNLVRALGLDYNKHYDASPEGEQQWKSVRYGFIVGLLDQDLDGFNIFGLIATFIMTFWPALLNRDFVRRINTPVVRAIPIVSKGKRSKLTSVDFFKEEDARTWFETNPHSHKFEMKFYKGLAGHDTADTIHMFRKLEGIISVYYLDVRSFETMEVYYGKKTAARKVALSTPVAREPVDGLLIPISQHFEIDVKLYQQDNLLRKLMNAIDGFVISRRKVFYVALKQGGKRIKVQGMAARVVAEADYHHGEASLELTIIRMTQGYPMARNLPLLYPDGNMGTRAANYANHGASRYVHTYLHEPLATKLFRSEDEYILEYDLVDGVRYEPKYYLPIIPYVLCETNIIPSTGWKVEVYARDINAIFKNIRRIITGKQRKCKPLPMWLPHWKGKIVDEGTRFLSIGIYEYDPDSRMLRISELPLGICSKAYVKGSNFLNESADDPAGIQTKEWVEEVRDNTSDEQVSIQVRLKEGAYEYLTSDEYTYANAELDPFQHYFELYSYGKSHINLFSETGTVISFATYEDVFDHWFAFRKSLYAVRVERELIILRLRIDFIQAVQRFTEKSPSYGITNKMKIAELETRLILEGYIPYNQSVLDSPKFVSNAELEDAILKHGATFRYLTSMTIYELTDESYAKRAKKLKQLKERLEKLTDETATFPGANIWLEELNELEECITEGMVTGWGFNQDQFERPE